MNGIKINRAKFLVNAVILFIPIILLIGIFLYYIHLIQQNSKLDSMEANEMHIVDSGENVIKNDYQYIISDLKTIADVCREMLSSKATSSYEILGSHMLSFSREKKLYDQIRFIDSNGLEKIRIDYNYGKPEIRPQNKLQNKASRYYFQDSIVLGPGEIFISPIDLNIENGEVERPPRDLDVSDEVFFNIWRSDGKDSFAKPMIRFAMPVYLENGEKIGIVILNYYGVQLIKKYDETHDHEEQVLLSNSAGYYINGSTPEQEWGFMREHETAKDSNIKNDFPGVWERLKTEDTGQYYSKKGLVTFKKVYPISSVKESSSRVLSELDNSKEKMLDNEEYYWVAITNISQEKLNTITEGLHANLLALFWSLFVVIGLGAIIISYLLQINKERKREKEIFETQYKFISMMSHQLRTPLSSVLLNLYESAEKTKDKDLMEIYHRLSHLNSLVNNLLLVNEYEAGCKIKIKQKFSLNDLVENCLQVFDLDVEKKGLSIKYIKPSFKGLLKGDKEKIEKVVCALIDNAVEYSKKNGEIEIELQKKDDELELKVKDKGIGIPKSDQDKIFSKFYRASNASLGKNEGSGVSLYLAKIFVEAHDGSIEFESDEGGTMFCLSLPLKK